MQNKKHFTANETFEQKKELKCDVFLLIYLLNTKQATYDGY